MAKPWLIVALLLSLAAPAGARTIVELERAFVMTLPGVKLPATRELARRRAAHRPESDDADVGHHGCRHVDKLSGGQPVVRRLACADGHASRRRTP